MKKIICMLLCMLMLMSIAGCKEKDDKSSGNEGAVSEPSAEETTSPAATKNQETEGASGSAENNVSTTSAFAKEEIDAAINCVKKYIPEETIYTLDKIWFDEKVSDKEVKGYITTGRGSENGIDQNNVIVLLSNISVGEHGSASASEPNEKRDNWMWILIRKDANAPWKVDGQGY
jgi:hypothetical protein